MFVLACIHVFVDAELKWTELFKGFNLKVVFTRKQLIKCIKGLGRTSATPFVKKCYRLAYSYLSRLDHLKLKASPLVPVYRREFGFK